eukprot:Colp12_sorted_trinity150504_noHs@28333
MLKHLPPAFASLFVTLTLFLLSGKIFTAVNLLDFTEVSVYFWFPAIFVQDGVFLTVIYGLFYIGSHTNKNFIAISSTVVSIFWSIFALLINQLGAVYAYATGSAFVWSAQPKDLGDALRGQRLALYLAAMLQIVIFFMFRNLFRYQSRKNARSLLPTVSRKHSKPSISPRFSPRSLSMVETGGNTWQWCNKKRMMYTVLILGLSAYSLACYASHSDSETWSTLLSNCALDASLHTAHYRKISQPLMNKTGPCPEPDVITITQLALATDLPVVVSLSENTPLDAQQASSASTLQGSPVESRTESVDDSASLNSSTEVASSTSSSDAIGSTPKLGEEGIQQSSTDVNTPISALSANQAVLA